MFEVVERGPQPLETEEPIQEYVLGFLQYDNSHSKFVVLIEKKRPDWQAGLHNGVGGHIEPGETPFVAMVREFEEETGLTIPDWKKFCIMNGAGWTVHCFSAFRNGIPKFRSMTDETVYGINVNRVMKRSIGMIENLPWLLQMIESQKQDGVKFYSVEYIR